MNQWRNYQGRIFSGLVIIAIGVVFLLVNMDKLDFGDFISTYWPMILILIGISHLLTSGFRNAGVALFLIVIGAFFQLNNWDVLGGRVWAYFWPLLIIAAGLWIIFKPRPKGFGENVPEIKQDDLGAFVIFSGLKRRFESDKFRGGKADRKTAEAVQIQKIGGDDGCPSSHTGTKSVSVSHFSENS